MLEKITKPLLLNLLVSFLLLFLVLKESVLEAVVYLVAIVISVASGSFSKDTSASVVVFAGILIIMFVAHDILPIVMNQFTGNNIVAAILIGVFAVYLFIQGFRMKFGIKH